MREARRHYRLTTRREWRLGTPVEAKDFEYLLHRVREEAVKKYGRTTDDQYSVEVGDDEVIVYFDVVEQLPGDGQRTLALTEELRAAVKELRDAHEKVDFATVTPGDGSRLLAAVSGVLRHLHVT